jgi:hypothetical protein
MGRLFGVPVESLALIAALIDGAIVLGLVVAIARRPALGRIALRSLPRRPGV